MVRQTGVDIVLSDAVAEFRLREMVVTRGNFFKHVCTIMALKMFRQDLFSRQSMQFKAWNVIHYGQRL